MASPFHPSRPIESLDELFGREAVLNKILRRLENSSQSIVGEPGIGRSSILAALELRLRDQGHRVIVVDLTALDSMTAIWKQAGDSKYVLMDNFESVCRSSFVDLEPFVGDLRVRIQTGTRVVLSTPRPLIEYRVPITKSRTVPLSDLLPLFAKATLIEPLSRTATTHLLERGGTSGLHAKEIEAITTKVEGDPRWAHFAANEIWHQRVDGEIPDRAVLTNLDRLIDDQRPSQLEPDPLRDVRWLFQFRKWITGNIRDWWRRRNWPAQVAVVMFAVLSLWIFCWGIQQVPWDIPSPLGLLIRWFSPSS